MLNIVYGCQSDYMSMNMRESQAKESCMQCGIFCVTGSHCKHALVMWHHRQHHCYHRYMGYFINFVLYTIVLYIYRLGEMCAQYINIPTYYTIQTWIVTAWLTEEGGVTIVSPGMFIGLSILMNLPNDNNGVPT